MRKPSDLKIYVNTKIQELSKEYFELLDDKETRNTVEAVLLKAQLNILYTVQKICEERKKY